MGLLERLQEFWVACGAARVGMLLHGLGSRLKLGVHTAALSCCGGELGSS